MEIEIKVSEKQENINPAILSRIRRTINVLCDAGFDINLSFKDGDKHDNKDENASPYMGGMYPHHGYFIRMTKDTNTRLDRPIVS